jgi:hypothetical protein
MSISALSNMFSIETNYMNDKFNLLFHIFVFFIIIQLPFLYTVNINCDYVKKLTKYEI